MNYGLRFVTLYRRLGSRPSPWKRKIAAVMFNRNLKPELFIFCMSVVGTLFVVVVFPFSVSLIKLSQIRMQRGKINHYEFKKWLRDEYYSLDWAGYAAWGMKRNI